MRFRGAEASNAVIAQRFDARVPRNEGFWNGQIDHVYRAWGHRMDAH